MEFSHVLSHFQFAQRFDVNTINREQFLESICRRVEIEVKHYSKSLYCLSALVLQIFSFL